MTREEAKAILENDIVDGHVEGNARFMDAFWMAVDALSQEPCIGAVSRDAVFNAIEREDKWLLAAKGHNGLTEIAFSGLKARVDALPSVTPSITRDIEKSNFSQEQYLLDTDSAYQIGYEKGKKDSRCKGEWIPVSERLPENTYPVNITWVNHDPEPYYAIIKDKPFTATGHYCNGKWWWYSVTCQDYLDEYGHSDVDAMDEAIEVTAWMPLPKPYEPQERESDV